MPQPPPEGQYFTLNPVQPPKPKPAMNWGLPIAIALLAVPLLMFGFGFSQQQTAPAPATSPTTKPETQSFAAPQASPTATPQPTSEPQPEPSSDIATLPVARIHSPGMAANLRTAPTLHSQVSGVLMDGDLVEIPPSRRVQQDGVVWVSVRYRGQNGWVASNFIGGQANAQP